MNKVLGTKFKIVSGYQGTAQSSLAMERGEVEGVTMGWFPVKTTKPEWVREKKINFLVQFLTERHADLPDVPTIVELARTPEEKQLFALFANDGEVGKAHPAAARRAGGDGGDACAGRSTRCRRTRTTSPTPTSSSSSGIRCRASGCRS